MRIVDIKVTDGPNFWSINRQQLVVMTLDLEEMEELPTDKIPGFHRRIRELIPSLYEHRCSECRPGGFFDRVLAGTWMGHVIEHIALELQSLAGMETGFGRTREAGRKGLYHVVFSYVDAEAGKYAAKAAVRVAEALAKDNFYDLTNDIADLASLWRKNKIGPSTSSIIEEAKKRDIPVIRLNGDSLVQLGYGSAQRRIEAAVAGTTSNIAVELAADKEATKRMLAGNGIPVPDGDKIASEDDLRATIERIGYPVVIKPFNGNHGRGVTMDLRDFESVVNAFRMAKSHSDKVICERFITGQDFRILVINNRFTAAALRTPAAVTGNGVNSVRELVDLVNADPQRGDCHEKALTKIMIDAVTTRLLADLGLTLDSILPQGHELWLKSTANLSTGGTATDVTDGVHGANIAMFERIARIIGLNICGIDVVASSLAEPLSGNGGVVLEVNAGPGLRMHLQPTKGRARNVARPIVDMLFPGTVNGRIPIIAITGTNGKTTTTRLIAHIGKYAGHKVGFTTTDGIYIHGHQIMAGDCTGPFSARVVLRDPGVNLAVLECARGGLLREGLGFDKCDVAVITNIAEDHLGTNGIDSLDKLAKLKGVLAESVRPEGYAVLNADDDLVYNLRERVRCRVALFSMDASSNRIRDHVREGGIAAVFENGHLSVIEDGVMRRLGPAAAIPITHGGLARFNINNALSASLAAYVQGVDPAEIFQALVSFVPSPESIPGRMNVFDFGGFKIIVDYAHNTHGLQAVGGFLHTLPASGRIGVIGGVGDRRDQDIVSLGAEAARIFDEIIIRQDVDLRGRSAENLNGLLLEGIRQVDPLKKVVIIPEEREAVNNLLHRVKPGMVAAVFADNIPAVLAQVKDASGRTQYQIHEEEFV